MYVLLILATVLTIFFFCFSIRFINFGLCPAHFSLCAVSFSFNKLFSVQYPKVYFCRICHLSWIELCQCCGWCFHSSCGSLTVKVLLVHSLVLWGSPPPLRPARTPPPPPGLRWRWDPTMVSIEWLLTLIALWKQEEGEDERMEEEDGQKGKSVARWNTK